MRISDWSSGLCSSDLAIWAVFPEASFVNVIRDGRDGAVSAFIRFRSKLRADLTQLDYARAYATGWAERIRAARQAAAGRRYLEVRYEALHAHPESEAGQLFEFPGASKEPPEVAETLGPARSGALSGGRRRGARNPPPPNPP